MAHRSTINIVHAIDTDISGAIAPSGHKACSVFVVGENRDTAIHIAYNTEIAEYGNVVLPTSTPQALNGPQAEEWRAAYAKEILVWVDDILVGFKGQALYDAFVAAYQAILPSRHHLGSRKFAGLTIDYKPGVSLQIDQRPHIEMAYNKFVLDKVAAAKSPAVSRIAISDRDSPRHYSRIALAANDQERSAMKTKPFLSALATLMYVAFWTLPHLVYYCSHLGQFMHDPSPHAFDAVIDLIIYSYFNREHDVIIYTKGP